MKNQEILNYLPGTLIDMFDFEEENERVRELKVEKPAKGEHTLLGITKAALATDSVSYQQLHSKKQQEFLQMLLLKVKLIH